MRISTRTIYRMPIVAIQEQRRELAELQLRIAPGRRVLRPSDDPASLTAILRSRRTVRTSVAAQRSLQGMRSFLEEQEAVLGLIGDVLERIQSLAYRAADDSLGSDARGALAVELDAALDGLLELGRARWNGVYLFGGRASQRDPFVVERDARGMITALALGSEDAAPRAFLLASGEKLTLGATAADVWGEGGVSLHDLVSLRDLASSDDGEGIRGLLVRLEEHASRVRAQQAVVGVQVRRLESLEEALETRRVEAEASRSRWEDLEMPEAAARLQELEASLEAALAVAARTRNLSLLDFLR